MSLHISRRAALSAFSAVAALGLCPFCNGAAHAQTAGPVGCLLRGDEAAYLAKNYRILSGSGDAEADDVCRAYARALRSQFRVNPDFGFYDDAGGGARGTPFARPGNAFATTARLIGSGDGTVLFGVSLLRSVTARNHLNRRWPVMVGVILAHEWGHTVQFSKRHFAHGRGTELHADYLAGWFVGRATRDRNVASEGMYRIFGLGDHLPFNDPAHHGRPVERASAFSAGFDAAERITDIDDAYASRR